jgi:sarcosine oxidase subunit gamma
MSKPNLQAVPLFEAAPQARKRNDRNVVFKPYAQSPLHPFSLPSKARVQDDSCGVWMNELPLLGYIVVRGNAQDPDFNDAVRDVIGIDLPTTPSTFVAFPHGIAMWQTPDEWLLICSCAVLTSYRDDLGSALSALHAQVVDNSGGLTQVYVSGARHVELLRHVSVYDFESLTPGRAVNTVCNKANITVYRHDSHGVFVIFRRSFSDYVWRMLSKAARPYGLSVTELAFRVSHPVLRLL